jgi:predicted protein tyrosine phosphatase
MVNIHIVRLLIILIGFFWENLRGIMMINVKGLQNYYPVDEEMAKLGTLVLSKIQCVDWKPAEKYPLISIRDAGECALDDFVKKNYLEVLEVVFFDVLDSNSMSNRPAISLDDAGVIYHFFQKYRDQPLVIHCRGGVSRSSGVALSRGILTENWKLVRAIVSSDKFCPNPTVIRKIISFPELLL